MALLDILVYPNERLRRVAEPVKVVDPGIRELVRDMAETMYAAPGIGLAAVQVDRPLQIITIDVSDQRDDLRVFINPQIVEQHGEQICEEGCLSVPEIFAEVPRAEQITVRALNADGESFELQADGLLAVCIQHEIDHLHGKVFVDYLSRLKRDRIRKKLKKMAKLAPTAA